MNRLFARFVFVLLVLMASIGVAFAESWRPIEFVKGSSPIMLATDGEVKLTEIGAIEIGFEISAKQSDLLALPDEMTLFSQEDQGKVRFRVSIVNHGKGLRLNNGDRSVDQPFDLSKGGYFQLGISCAGDNVRVVVNDNEGAALVQAEIGFGENRRFPIYLGGRADQSTGFVGKIYYLRVWGLPVRREDFETVSSSFGFPDSNVAQADYLLFYTKFTDAGVAAFYTTAPTLADIYTEDAIFVGGKVGTPFVCIIPDGSVWSGLQVAADSSGVRALRVLALNDAGYVDNLAPVGLSGAVFDQTKEFLIDEGDTLTQIYGTTQTQIIAMTNKTIAWQGNTIQSLLSIGFRTANKDSGRFGPTLSPAGLNVQDFIGAYTKFPVVDAIYGYFDGKVITGIGFARRLMPKFDDIEGVYQPAGQAASPQKVVRPRTVGPPRVSDQHGTYQPRETMRLRLANRGLTLLLDSPSLSDMQLRLQPDGSYSVNSGPSMKFDNDNSFRIDYGALHLSDFRYDKTNSYPVIPTTSGNFGSFAGQFNTGNQTPLYQKSFSGYDLTTVDPMNFQDDSGRKSKNVFVAPDPLGFDYYPDQGKNVPHGLLLVSDAMRTSETQTTASRTAREHAETQSGSLGFNIGVPKGASFGIKSEVSNEIKQATDSQSQIVYHAEVETKYALVADMAKIRLDPGFRAAILALLQKSRALGRYPTQAEWESAIISIYGTHYANAVTSGLASRSLLRYSKQASTELTAEKKSLEQSASVLIGKVKAGIKSASGQGFSDSVEKELTKEMEQMQQVGLPDQPAPIFMDFRPLSELLSMLFWDDPAVWRGMRASLELAIKTYVANNAPDYSGPEYIWEPYGFAAKLLSLDFTVNRTTPPFRPGAINIPLDGFSGQFGFDLIYKARTPMIVKTIDPANFVQLSLDGNPVQKNLHYDLPGDEDMKYFTASEMCSKTIADALAPSYRIDRTQGSISSDLATVFPGTTTAGDPSMQFIYPLDVTVDAKTFSFQGQVVGSGFPFVLKASARRLPDPSGGFKDIPNCVAKR